MKARACWVMVAGLMLGACASSGPAFKPVAIQPQDAVIYVYRPYRFGGSLLHPVVTCGSLRAAVGPGGYHAFVVKPGTVRCRASTDREDQVELDIAPGSVNYVQEEIGWGVWVGHPHLYPMDADRAQNDVQSCCKLDQ